MMTFIVLLVAALAATGFVALPLLRKRDPRQETQNWRTYDRAVYQDQLAEIDRDLENGTLSAEQAEAARLEISRRLLSTGGGLSMTGATLPVEPDSVSKIITVAVFGFVAFGAISLYWVKLGEFEMLDYPYKARLEQARTNLVQDGLVQTAGLPEKIAETRKQIEEDIFNPELRMKLAQYLMDAEKFPEALYHAKEGARMAPRSVPIQAQYGRLRVLYDGGVVTLDTHNVFMRTLFLDEKESSSRFFLGMERWQGGDPKGAVAIWNDLLRDLPEESQIRAYIDRRLEEAKATASIDPAQIRPRHPLEFTEGSWVALAHPEARVRAKTGNVAPPTVLSKMSLPEAGRMPSNLTLELTRAEMGALKANVEIVNKKLQRSPRDFDLLMQLARTQRMLREWDEALVAYRTALEIRPRDMEARRGVGKVLVARAESNQAERMPPEALAIWRTVLSENAEDADALYYLGLDAVAGGDYTTAKDLWSRLLVVLPLNAPQAADISRRLELLPD